MSLEDYGIVKNPHYEEWENETLEVKIAREEKRDNPKVD